MNNRDTSKMCPDYSVKGWSNQVGYGHLVQSTIQGDGSVKADAHPWNRIQQMPKPSHHQVEPKSAWSPPISASLQQQMDESCKICPNSKPSPAKYSGFEEREYAPVL